MISNIRSCSFTGHRPKSFSFGFNEESDEFLELKNKMRNSIIQVCNEGCRVFYCGMAEGVDLWFAELVLELKDSFTPALQIIPVVPYLSQPASMTEKNKKRYLEVMKNSRERYLVSKEYHKTCFLKRNRFLVDSADALIAVFNEKEQRSGTAQTIRYATSKKKKIYLIKV